MVASGTVVKALITIITVIVVIIVGQQLLAGPLSSVLNFLNINTTNPNSRNTLTYKDVAEMTYSSFLTNVGKFIQSDKQVSVIKFDVSRNLVFQKQNLAFCIVGTKTGSGVLFQLKQGKKLKDCLSSGTVIEKNSSITLDKKKVSFKSLKYLYQPLDNCLTGSTKYYLFPISLSSINQGSYRMFQFPSQGSGSSWVVLVKNPIVSNFQSSFDKNIYYPCIADSKFLLQDNAKLNGSAIFSVSDYELTLLNKRSCTNGIGLDIYFLNYVLKNEKGAVNSDLTQQTDNFVANSPQISNHQDYSMCSDVKSELEGDKNIINSTAKKFLNFVDDLKTKSVVFEPVPELLSLKDVLSSESSFVSSYYNSSLPSGGYFFSNYNPHSYLAKSHGNDYIDKFAYSLKIVPKDSQIKLSLIPNPKILSMSDTLFGSKNLVSDENLKNLNLYEWDGSFKNEHSMIIPAEKSLQRHKSSDMNFQFFTTYNLLGSSTVKLLNGTDKFCFKPTKKLNLISFDARQTGANSLKYHLSHSDPYFSFIKKVYALSTSQSSQDNGYLCNVLGTQKCSDLKKSMQTDLLSYKDCSDVTKINDKLSENIQSDYGNIVNALESDLSDNNMIDTIDLSALENYCGKYSTGSEWQKYYPKDNVYLCLGKSDATSVSAKAVVGKIDTDPCETKYAFESATNLLSNTKVYSGKNSLYMDATPYLFSKRNVPLSSASELTIDPCKLKYESNNDGNYPMLIITKYNGISLKSFNSGTYSTNCLMSSTDNSKNIVLMGDQKPISSSLSYNGNVFSGDGLFYYTLLENEGNPVSNFDNTWIYKNMKTSVDAQRKTASYEYRTCDYLESQQSQSSK